jgi:hypothetical protein
LRRKLRTANLSEIVTGHKWRKKDTPMPRLGPWSRRAQKLILASPDTKV